jgi:O-antigen/teichoic acid export membrane protein
VDAINIVALSIILAAIASIVLIAIAWIFNKPISYLLGSHSISTWLYLVPLAVLLNGVHSSLNYWSNRNKFYRLMARRRVFHSGGTSAAQLGLGVLGANVGGLIIGSILGQALASWMMANIVSSYSPGLWRSIRKRRVWILARRYKSCPQLLVPAHTLSALSVQLPVVFINSLFGSSSAGLFMLAERAVGMPLTLISTSIGDVFRQEINECFLAGRNCREKFLSTLRKLIAVATPPFVLLTVFGPPLFAAVFGEEWRTSGEYAQLMSPMFYLRFISNPLSLVAIVAQKNKFELLWQIFLLIFLVLAAISHYYVRLDPRSYIIIFVGICITFDLVNLAACYKFACAGDSIRLASRFR